MPEQNNQYKLWWKFEYYEGEQGEDGEEVIFKAL